MSLRRSVLLLLSPAAVGLLGACGSATQADITTPTASLRAIPAAAAATARLLDWPEFGLDAQRSNAPGGSPAIPAATVPRLRRASVSLPGTVDSSPIYLHGAAVGGSSHNVLVATTTYGKTVAIDAD